MITAEKTLLDKISALPESMQIEVEHYVEFLLSKCSQQAEAEAETEAPRKRRQAGILKGKIWMADDFDAPLEDMQEYM